MPSQPIDNQDQEKNHTIREMEMELEDILEGRVVPKVDKAMLKEMDDIFWHSENES